VRVTRSLNMITSCDPDQALALRDLAGRLISLTAGQEPDSDEVILRDADVIVSHIEVSDRHGVGKLLRMMFLGEPNLISIRSKSVFGGRNELGSVSLCISHADHSRDVVFAKVVENLCRHTVRRVLCVPYFPDDVRTAIAIKEIFGVPLCTYIMDDQNICVPAIPDILMEELLSKSDLLLGISAEMCIVYERKYGRRMWPMPPLAPGRLIPSRLNVPQAEATMRGVIIGNIWGQRWMELLRGTVRNSGISLSWYSNGDFGGLPGGKDTLLADSITPFEPLRDDPLVQVLRQTWFAVVPSGLLDDEDDRRFIAQLSLPSRIPYMMATSHIPILVLGSPETASARFVQRFGIGAVAGYTTESFVKAVHYIMQPEVNLAMRKRALLAAGMFTDTGAAEWIWESLARGEAADLRFEGLLPRRMPDLQI
jgi:hypothetical protein